jgi:4-aminobutyrate aminotransferase-like enzyme
MAGIELVRNRVSKEPASRERDTALRFAFERGLTLLPAGESVIRFCPPLTINKQEIDTGLRLLDGALSAMEGF